MKTIRTFAVALAACATLFSACQKDNEGQVSLDALIADQPSSPSKVYINENRFACWNDLDEVKINNNVYAVAATDATHATISSVTTSSSYTAAYPADMTTGCDNGVVTMSIDPVQTYETDASGAQKIKSPMVGYTQGSTLAFHNVASLVNINIVNMTGNDLKMVSIEIKNKNGVSIAGNGSVSNVQSAAPTFAVNDGGSSTVNLNFNGDVTWPDGNPGKDFYLAIAPFSTASAIEIDVWAIDNNGQLIKYSKSSNTNLTIARNSIAPISFRSGENFHMESMGYGTQENPYLIKDEGDLNVMRVMTNKAAYSNKYYKLANSIDVSSKEWQPFCQTTNFNGNFDGNGKTLTLKLSPKDDKGSGLFSRINGATIKNLTLSGSCVSTSYSQIGAICGRIMGGTNYITNCTNNIAIEGRNNIGGLIGMCNINGNTVNNTISECTNNAAIKASASSQLAIVGGIVGHLANSESITTTITKCTNKGTITATSEYTYSVAGGIVGQAGSSLTMTDCGNTATISTSTIGYAAGLVGSCQNYTSTITNCYSQGNIHTQSCKNIGGITTVANSGQATIKNCYFSGEITGSTANSTNVSSIAAQNGGTATATYCYALNYYDKGSHVDPNYYFNQSGIKLESRSGDPTTTPLTAALNDNREGHSLWTGSPFPILTW